MNRPLTPRPLPPRLSPLSRLRDWWDDFQDWVLFRGVPRPPFPRHAPLARLRNRWDELTNLAALKFLKLAGLEPTKRDLPPAFLKPEQLASMRQHPSYKAWHP